MLPEQFYFHITVVYHAPTTLTIFIIWENGLPKMLNKVASTTHLHPLLLSAIIHNGEDFMKPWDLNPISFINMLNPMWKGYKEKQEP